MGTKEDLYEKLDKYNVINPILTYKGEYVFQDFRLISYDEETDNLFLNSIVENGVNKYGKFRDKYFYRPFTQDLLNSIPTAYLFPLLCNFERPDGKGRMIAFAYEAAVHNLLIGLGVDIAKELGDSIDQNDDEEIEETDEDREINSLKDVHSIFDEIAYNRKLYKEKRDMLLKYQRDRANFPDIEKVAYIFAKVLGYNVKSESDITHEMAKQIMYKIDDKKLEKTIKLFTNVLFNFRYLKEDLKLGPLELSMDEFKACFDRDKFYLLYMKTIIENQEEPLAESDKCALSFVEVAQYLHFIDELDLKDYNPKIKFYDISKKRKVDYSLKDLRAEYEELRKKCPATRVVDYISDEQIEKMGLSYNYDAYLTLLKTLGSEEDTEAIVNNWDILPSGTKEVVDTRPKYRRTPGPKKEKTVTEDTILYRKYILQATNYKIKLVGRDKFSGYMGYLYPNGLVVFEVFYEPNGEIVQSGATYIMNYKNFVEFCKLTKQEIIEYIKDQGNSDVRRLYHKATWADNLNKVLSAVEETQETVFAVETLIQNVKTKKRIDSDY